MSRARADRVKSALCVKCRCRTSNNQNCDCPRVQAVSGSGMSFARAPGTDERFTAHTQGCAAAARNPPCSRQTRTPRPRPIAGRSLSAVRIETIPACRRDQQADRDPLSEVPTNVDHHSTQAPTIRPAPRARPLTIPAGTCRHRETVPACVAGDGCARPALSRSAMWRTGGHELATVSANRNGHEVAAVIACFPNELWCRGWESNPHGLTATGF